jgi:hypothetical protein
LAEGVATSAAHPAVAEQRAGVVVAGVDPPARNAVTGGRGLLAVRSRFTDVLTMSLLGGSLMLLTVVTRT